MKKFIIIFSLVLVLSLSGCIQQLVCGNGVCESNLGENDDTCPQDCRITTTTNLKIIDPGDGIYLGAYNFDNGVEEFEKAIGKKAAIGCKNDIKDGGTEGTLPKFDKQGHETCYQNGYISTFGVEYKIPSPTHSPQAIINGALDNEIKQVAQEIKSWNRPIFWLYQREPRLQANRYGPDGDPYVPSGYDSGGYGPYGNETYEDTINRGGNPKAEYGDPNKLDGPERYVDAARHIHDLVESIAPNIVTWVMGAFTTGNVDEQIKATAPEHYTSYKDYYLGDDYVDWHALDLHAFPVDGELASLPQEIEPAYSDAMRVNPNKPLVILEFGIVKANNRPAWFNEFFQKVKTDYPQLAAILYMGTISSDDPAAKVWQQEMQANPNFWLSEVKTG